MYVKFNAYRWWAFQIEAKNKAKAQKRKTGILSLMQSITSNFMYWYLQNIYTTWITSILTSFAFFLVKVSFLLIGGLFWILQQ